MFIGLGKAIVRLRIPLLVALLVTTGVLAFSALEVKFDFSPRSIFLTADDEVQFLEEHREIFGDEDAILMVLVEADNVFEPDVLETIGDLTERIADIDHVEQALSLTNMVEIGGMPGMITVSTLIGDLPETPDEIEALKAKAVGNRLYVNRFVNATGTAAAVIVKIEDGFVEELERRPLLEAVEALMAEVESPVVTLALSGMPLVHREYTVLLQGDMVRTIAAASLIICFVLFFLFRSFYGLMLPMAAVGMAQVLTVAFMVAVGDGFNIINAIVPTLLLVIGVGDAVHFLTTYYEELGEGRTQMEAVEGIVRKVGAACLLTSFTAAIGFASLIVARIDIIKHMGVVAAAGLMLTYVVMLLLIPAVLSLVKVPKAGRENDPNRGAIGALLRWTAEVTITKRKEVLGISFVIVAVLAAGSFRIETNNFLLEELFKVNPVSRALHHTEEVLTGVIPVEIAIEVKEDGDVFEPSVLRAIEALQTHMEADPYIGHTISIVDLVKELSFVMEGERVIPDSRRKIAQYITFFEMSEDNSFLEMVVDGPRRHARISGSQKDWGTDQFFAWYTGTGVCDERAACGKPIQDLIDESFGEAAGVPATARVTGGNLVAARALSRLVADMLWSLGTAFLVITLLMMLLLRSFRIGLLSMIPNVLPLLITLGFMGWVGIPLRTSTVLIFSVSLGVAANDTIHFLVRYRREVFRTGDREQAIRDTMMSTGRAIIFTSVLLVFGFGTMMTTRFVGIFQMGVLGSVTLFAALLGDLLILPVALGMTKPWSKALEAKAAAE